MQNKIAILIPAYNAANYLPALFETIRKQSVPFDEIICYDDFSIDNTAQVAEQLGAIVLRGDENRGAAFARNRMIEKCSSNWIHFHDADDLLSTSFVAECKSILDTADHTKPICLLSDMKVINK